MKAKKGINANTTNREKSRKDKEDVKELATGDVGSYKGKLRIKVGKRTMIFARDKKTADIMKDNFNGHIV